MKKPILLFFAIITTASQAGVTVNSGDQSVRLDNGIVSFEVQKSNGDLLKASFKGKSLLSEPGYLDWVAGGNNHIGGGTYALVVDPTKNGGTAAEISITQKYNGQKTPFDVTLHYALRADVPGLYVWATFEHAANYPAGSIAQSRWGVENG